MAGAGKAKEFELVERELPGAGKAKEFELVEPELLVNLVDSSSGQAEEIELVEPELLVNLVDSSSGKVNSAFIHLNSLAISDEDVNSAFIHLNSLAISDEDVNSAFIHLNSLAISDEDVFTISRAIPLSSVPKILDLYGNSIQILDLYGNSIQEATGVLTMERINQGIIKQQCNSLETICLANNILGPSMMFTLRDTLQHCR
ncbi:hypothetical protein T484DRAFT_1838701 [Baffinella frigidus]|nr:hypothetical protein T484DRAFT_1838701 [Cryptophyta sp. CCMP2293]